jgi:hypothetical protein
MKRAVYCLAILLFLLAGICNLAHEGRAAIGWLVAGCATIWWTGTPEGW